MKKYLYLLLIILTPIISNSQSNQVSIFTNEDKLYINLTEQEDFYYSHKVEKGHTIYSLSKAYNIPSSQLYSYNNMADGASISIGQHLKIPMPQHNLYKGTDLSDITKGHYIPVYYKTQPKDNLFRISRVYFNQSTEDLILRNNLKNNNLDLGQDLLIGWLIIDGEVPTRVEIESEFGEEDLDINYDGNLEDISVSLGDGHLETEAEIDTTKSKYPPDFNPTLLGTIEYQEDMKTINKREVAVWDKSMHDNGAVFALHESALIDSYINVFNPMFNKSVRIKVIGRIPYGTYTNDVKLVISPRAATQLRGLDRRFKVEIDYLIKE